MTEVQAMLSAMQQSAMQVTPDAKVSGPSQRSQAKKRAPSKSPASVKSKGRGSVKRQACQDNTTVQGTSYNVMPSNCNLVSILPCIVTGMQYWKPSFMQLLSMQLPVLFCRQAGSTGFESAPASCRSSFVVEELWLSQNRSHLHLPVL